MILTSFFSALGQMGDAKFRRVLLRGIFWAIALLITASFGLIWLIGTLTADSTSIPWVGEITWFDEVISWGAFFLFFVSSVFLMMPVATIITSMFLDEVAQAVENKHYPTLPEVPKVSFFDTVIDSFNFLGVLIITNILALIFYALFPPATIFIFWGLNGFLLGREYFTLAATRRTSSSNAKKLRKAHAGSIWLAGTLMAIPLSIPLINLLIPIIGAATFTHLFHKITAVAELDQTSLNR